MIYKRFHDAVGDKFLVENERIAAFDLALAATALNLQAVRNLFSAEQASRIEGWVEKLIDSKEWGEYAIGEVKAYGEIFQRDVANIKMGADPFTSIPARLLQRWLGNGVRDFEIKTESKNTGGTSPIMLAIAVDALMPFVGTWKAIKDQYELAKEDLPSVTDWEAEGFYDLGKYPDEWKPDGTVIYRDEFGKLSETWLQPKKMMQLLTKYKAKKVGTTVRVLVKGPWDGIKEARMQLTDQTIGAYADERGIAYALCVFTNGNAGCHLMKKRMWENLDRIEAIMADTSLTEAQREAALKNLT